MERTSVGPRGMEWDPMAGSNRASGFCADGSKVAFAMRSIRKGGHMAIPHVCRGLQGCRSCCMNAVMPGVQDSTGGLSG